MFRNLQKKLTDLKSQIEGIGPDAYKKNEKKLNNFFKKKLKKESFETFLSKLTDLNSPIKEIRTDTYEKKLKKDIKKNFKKTI